MPSLTRAEAQRRSSLLTVHSYDVDLDLSGDGEVYRSATTVHFAAAEPGTRTFLDVKARDLHSVRLNGRELDHTSWADGRLSLTGLAADNRLEVVADMRYSREGEGLHRYTDPADGLTYLYAFVYADHAPRVFACFDQPDLKAPYRFTVTTPADWTVLGTSPATQIAPGRWRLAESAPQATYLTTIVAGPYRSFTTEHDGIPLGVHCRASLAETLAPHTEEIFDVTARCLDEYRDTFGARYPFDAFHQVFVPEFSVLSLDHPGCVLLRELYLDPATESERETRAVVLAHGISLMWLAALVTHRWWDEFWLSQAFADYMAHRVTAKVTRFSGPPVTFSVRRKAQAYVADQRPSTHPVGVDGDDVQSVLLEMDRITYFKGHSVLRQLVARVGEDGLREGLRIYFTRHGYGTATYGDFLEALAEAIGEDLSGWGREWFGRAGVTTLEPELEIADGRIVSAAIRQSTPARTHTLNVGLYGDTIKVKRITVRGGRTEMTGLVGAPAPDLLVVNDGDLTYAKIRFDPRSQAALPSWLPRLSAQNRAMIWCAVLLAVHDGEFPAPDYLSMVGDQVRTEPELAILTEVLEQTRNDVLDRFLTPSRRPSAMAGLAAALDERLESAGTAISLLRARIDAEQDTGTLRGWLDGDKLPGAAGLDDDLGWRLRYRLAVLGGLSEAEIAEAALVNPGLDADQWAAKCRAARPDPVTKAEVWRTIMTDPEISGYQLWALAEGFWQPEQNNLTDGYVDRFFAEIPAAAARRGDLVTELLLRFLYPRYAAQPRTLMLAQHLLGGSELPPPLRRAVADHTDDLRRVVRARQLG
ncbi:aminopeptidase N [Winogradskya humida]|uniref:Aminopeptidase N n=1 Tax=Winogradskya humida TaxID=113566 RepID=A0ABQ3ZGU2_9ACTN|nr:aminopeptidase N [Actinoplanes humidus]GIE17795.1 aminopeptidase [Actinoplanes humidus]